MHTLSQLGRTLRAAPWAGRQSLIRFFAAAVCAGGWTAAEADMVRVYWADSASHRVQRAKIDGTAVHDVVTGYEARNLALDAGSDHLYLVTAHDVYRSQINGENLRHIYNNMDSAQGFALDLTHGKMYVGDGGFNRIVRTNLDGSSSTALIEGLGNPTGISLDIARGKIYWVDAETRKIQRANTDGTGIEDLVTGLQSPKDLDLDLVHGKIYWTDSGADVIRRANLDGTQIENLIATGDEVFGIKLDLEGGKIYWTDSSRPVIQRANLDGAAIEDVVSLSNGPLLDNPIGLALTAVPEPSSLLLGSLGLAAALGWRKTTR